MSVIFVASSKTLSNWGASVGISKSLYKVGLADDAGDAVDELNTDKVATADDWKLVKATDAGDLAASDLTERLANADIIVDPDYYPKLRRASGIVRVRPETVENSMIVERALANEANPNAKIGPADIAAWIFRLLLR